jgi:hypothetical protein
METKNPAIAAIAGKQHGLFTRFGLKCPEQDSNLRHATPQDPKSAQRGARTHRREAKRKPAGY